MTRTVGFTTWIRALALLAAAAMTAAPASAEVEVRVQSRPVTAPIKVFVRVTGPNGVPDGTLTAADFTIQIDAQSAVIPFQFTQPPLDDPAQRLSVIFAIDYSSSVQDFFVDAIEAGVTTFIGNMTNGDHAAIIKFNNTNGVSVVQPFIAIDGAANDTLLIQALMDDYDGVGTNLIDALVIAADEFDGAVLPEGPKAVVLISDGDDNSSDLSQSDAIAALNANGIAVFSVSVGDISGDAAATALMTSIAADTGGAYFAGPDEDEIAAAYATITSHLNNSYVLTIPPVEVTDCDPHMLEVTVQGQAEPGSIGFWRCDTTPDDFHFADETGVEPGSVVVSNTVAITGIDMATEISVTDGEYSIGCGSTFTAAPGFISFEDEVCVRHTAATGFGASAGPTVLVVGGVASSFSSTTSAAPPPPGSGGGGGGATGVIELLLGLGALFARRRLTA
ncbi:MAG: VWA domain-containing protein [Steroidobacteraceae bacterium]